jgi:hypothetical protein
MAVGRGVGGHSCANSHTDTHAKLNSVLYTDVHSDPVTHLYANTYYDPATHLYTNAYYDSATHSDVNANRDYRGGKRALSTNRGETSVTHAHVHRDSKTDSANAD